MKILPSCASPSRDSPCLIVEVPDPDEITNAGLKALITQARDALENFDPSVFATHATKKPIKMRVAGQFFLDETHNRNSDPGGGRGTLLASGRHCASNLWEIHPVTKLE